MNIWASPPCAINKSGPCVSPIFHCCTRALLLADTWAPPHLPLKPSKTSSPYPLTRSAISNLRPRCRPASTAPAATKPPASAPSHRRPWPPPPSPKPWRIPIVLHGDKLTAAPARRAATPLAGRRPPATSLRLRLRSLATSLHPYSPAASDEPPPPLAGRQRRTSASACLCPYSPPPPSPTTRCVPTTLPRGLSLPRIQVPAHAHPG